MNQPKRRLGLSLTCVLIGCVVLAILATALHRRSLKSTASLFSSQQISKPTPRLVKASDAAGSSTASDRSRQLSFSNLPVAFEPNLGQTDPQVKYLARGNGYTLFLTPNEAVLSLAGRSGVGLGQPETPRSHKQLPPSPVVLRMRIVDGNAQPHAASSRRSQRTLR